MDRKKFIQNTLLSTTALLSGTSFLVGKNLKSKEIDNKKVLKQVGFNHLPSDQNIKNKNTMKTSYHPANSRGHANHGWLDSNHSFSFASYYNPDRTNFGALRVLNDDRVSQGNGFGKHPHDNMEIISIPLTGALEHEDNMGNKTVIKEGDVQVMSAGTGIMHSEYNQSQTDEVSFLQIWLFPNQKDVKPRYDQISIRDVQRKNELYQVLSPDANDDGVWVHQQAWFHMGDLETGTSVEYSLKNPDNGVYAFLLEGEVEIGGQKLHKRDGLGMWDTSQIDIKVGASSKILLMEVPLNF
ncbi:MAG: pirin family protein [Reichenbachiella sp.]